MTTRRALLQLAGAATLAGCTAQRTPPATHLIFVTTARGVSVLDQRGGLVTPPTRVAVALPDWSQVVTATPDGPRTRLVVEDLAARRVLWANTLAGQLEPRIVAPAGRLVASVTPGGAGIYGLHKPEGRERTTVVVSESAGERARLDLPGNLEPDAFSPDGSVLFLLDYVPATKPERYRAAAVDLASGKLTPIPGTETRAHRIDTVFDPRRKIHFTLYSYEPAATAYVDCLHTVERWTRRIALPPPFGTQRPGVHAIALSGDRLCVVHAPSASVADIDLDRLTVREVGRFATAGQLGKPNVVVTASGGLVVNVDRKLIATQPPREITTSGGARGIALGTGTDAWIGHPDGIVRYDLATAEETARIAVPDLYLVKHVRATASAR